MADVYESYGLSAQALDRLAGFGDLLVEAGFNVTGVREPDEIERVHFLDSLALLGVPAVGSAGRLADVGSGGGLPALVLALARPEMAVVAIESQRKKCGYLQHVVDALGLVNAEVCCQRAEDYARGDGRGAFDVVVSRAVADLAVLAEYSLPLLRLGGVMVAMKGSISAEERTRAEGALAILGADRLEGRRLKPFEGSRDRWVYLATKARSTPETYPRRPGIPGKRPLGGAKSAPGEGARR